MLTRRETVAVILSVFPPACLKNRNDVLTYIPTRGAFPSPDPSSSVPWESIYEHACTSVCHSGHCDRLSQHRQRGTTVSALSSKSERRRRPSNRRYPRRCHAVAAAA